MNKIVAERIVIAPTYCHGKPAIHGTRVPVIRILGSLAARMTREETADAYGVTQEDIDAALAFAIEIIETEKFLPLPLVVEAAAKVAVARAGEDDHDDTLVALDRRQRLFEAVEDVLHQRVTLVGAVDRDAGNVAGIRKSGQDRRLIHDDFPASRRWARCCSYCCR